MEGDVLSRDAMTARLTGAVRRHPQLTNAASPSQAVRLDPDTRVRLKRVSDVEKAAWPVVFDATPLTVFACVPAISSP